MTVAGVELWGRQVGAVSVARPGEPAVFEYTPQFIAAGRAVAPLRMPLRPGRFRFPELARLEAFAGLPGLLADALPDRWGGALIDAWLDAQGRDPASVDVVERLCSIGTRAMGALEFQPAVEPHAPAGADLQVAALVELASEVLAQREHFVAQLAANPDAAQMQAILTLGTSAGGARPKAIIAFNEATGQVRSGQVADPGPGFEHWLLKFDGVRKAGDHGLTDPQGWGAVEYAYWLMARAAGIEMTESRLLEEHGRRHFMTRRFDRPGGGRKLHMQTLAALDHVDYDAPGIYSYERSFALARKLGLGADAVEEMYRRMVFNVVARNQDDHVKNISFLMSEDGAWRLSPAYDLTFAHQPGNRWLDSHQMTINGKRDGFSRADLEAVARTAGLVRGRGPRIIDEVVDVVAEWEAFADRAQVGDRLRRVARAAHRLALPAG